MSHRSQVTVSLAY